MVGGQIYGQGINELTTDDIENAQFVTRARPSEGLRFTYLPMEATDYEYYPTKTDNSHNGGAQPTGDEATYKVKIANLTNLDFAKWPTTGTEWTGVGPDVQYSNNTHCVAIYWKGLPEAKDWLRIDVTRKFNGVPKTAIRDIVEVSRASKTYDSKKTFDVLRNLCINAPVGGHTLKELDRTQDRIQAALPNLAGDGMGTRIDSLQTLGELAGQLEAPMAEEKGLQGTSGAILGRLYPYDV